MVLARLTVRLVPCDGGWSYVRVEPVLNHDPHSPVTVWTFEERGVEARASRDLAYLDALGLLVRDPSRPPVRRLVASR